MAPSPLPRFTPALSDLPDFIASITRSAIFPLVDIDLDPHLYGHGVTTPHSPQSGDGGGGGPSGAQRHPSSSSTTFDFPSANGRPISEQCSADSQDSMCLALAAASASPSSSSIPSPPASLSSPASTGEGLANNREGFPLKGFLRIEVVGLEAAEVTFRPGDARRSALAREREEALAAEEQARR